jgi:hypothetical protein
MRALKVFLGGAMLDRRVTIIPIDFRDILREFEKLLSNPGYAQWQVEKVLQGVELHELTNRETAWLGFLEKAMNDKDMASNFIFPYLKVETEKFDSDEKELVAFFIRLMQKRPEYAKQMLDLMK